MVANLIASSLDYTNTTTSSGSSSAVLIIYLIVVVILVTGFWKTFTKAKQPGWTSIIPIYNVVVLLRVAGRSPWWTILYFIPLVNLIVAIAVGIDVAKRFGKGPVFGGVLCGLLYIGYLIIGFDSSTYKAVA